MDSLYNVKHVRCAKSYMKLRHFPESRLLSWMKSSHRQRGIDIRYSQINIIENVTPCGQHWVCWCINPDSKDPRSDVDWISIQHESVGSISNRRRSESLCYLRLRQLSTGISASTMVTILDPMTSGLKLCSWMDNRNMPDHVRHHNFFLLKLIEIHTF